MLKLYPNFYMKPIIVDNGIASPRASGNLRVDATSIAGATLDHDLVFFSRSTAPPQTQIAWGTSSYASLAAFIAATGKETHGLEADPLWGRPGPW